MSMPDSPAHPRFIYDYAVLQRIIETLNGAPLLIVARQATYVGTPTLYESALLLKHIAVEQLGAEHTLTHSVAISLGDITCAGRAPGNSGSA